MKKLTSNEREEVLRSLEIEKRRHIEQLLQLKLDFLEGLCRGSIMIRIHSSFTYYYNYAEFIGMKRW